MSSTYLLPGPEPGPGTGAHPVTLATRFVGIVAPHRFGNRELSLLPMLQTREAKINHVASSPSWRIHISRWQSILGSFKPAVLAMIKSSNKSNVSLDIFRKKNGRRSLFPNSFGISSSWKMQKKKQKKEEVQFGIKSKESRIQVGPSENRTPTLFGLSAGR